MSTDLSTGWQTYPLPFWTHDKGREDKEPQETCVVTAPFPNSYEQPCHKIAVSLGSGHRETRCFLWCDPAVGNHVVILYVVTIPRVKAVTAMC